jgi:V/A-type H+-transporting ATPase subunit I
MLKPREMSRVIIVGSKDHLENTIDVLYNMRSLHITDFRGEGEEFEIGKPLETASSLSEKLLFLRSAAKLLNVTEADAKHCIKVVEINANLRDVLSQLERGIKGKEDEKRVIEDGIRGIENKKAELMPFLRFPLNMDEYLGYESLAVFVGSVKNPLGEEIRTATQDFELFEDDEKKTIALFVPKASAAEVSKILSEKGFTEIRIPDAGVDPNNDGVNPSELIKALDAELEGQQKKLSGITQELEALKEKHAEFILASDEFLTIEVQKAEAPLRFATTKNSFVIDGWVLKERLEDVKKKLGDVTSSSLYIETIDEKVAEEEIPVELRNPKAAKSFEVLIDLFSKPLYKEIDPTSILFITFPFFFGIMIGDVGYALVLVLFGIFLRKKQLFGIGGPSVGNIIIIGGIFSMLFGVFLFGEAFGIHFAPKVVVHTWDGAFAIHGSEKELYWSGLLGMKDATFGYNIAGVALPLSKLNVKDMLTLLLLSPLMGIIHMSLGLMLGFRNEKVYHGMRKAFLVKFGWLFLFASMFVVFYMVLAIGLSRVIGGLLGIKDGIIPSFAYPGIMFYVVVGMIVLSIVMLVIGEGTGAIFELPSVLANSLSYTRLAAVGASKAGMALAANIMVFEMPSLIILGIMIHAMIPFLGLIAAGLHSLRLQYYEFFTKFFQGGGSPFIPFGYERRYTEI